MIHNSCLEVWYHYHCLYEKVSFQFSYRILLWQHDDIEQVKGGEYINKSLLQENYHVNFYLILLRNASYYFLSCSMSWSVHMKGNKYQILFSSASMFSLACFLAISRLVCTSILCPLQSRFSSKHLSLQHFLHNR